MTGEAFVADLLLDDGTIEHFRASGSADSGTEYEVVVTVEGRCTTAPTHAVFARWRIERDASTTAFEDSRRALFGLRT